MHEQPSAHPHPVGTDLDFQPILNVTFAWKDSGLCPEHLSIWQPVFSGFEIGSQTHYKFDLFGFVLPGHENAVFCSGGNGSSEDTLGINTLGINCAD